MTWSTIRDLSECLGLYSRLPVGAVLTGNAALDFSRVAWAVPCVGAAIGGVAGISIMVCRLMHLSPNVAATCAIATLAIVTGAIHEDGLADTVDGFGGGGTREAKLAIMRDSRLGAFGALSLCLSTLLRVSALAAIIEHGVMLAALSLVAVGAISRTVGLIPMMILSPARVDGAGATVAAPSAAAMRLALLLAMMLGLCPTLVGASIAQTVVAQAAAVGCALYVTKLAQRQIGGYTGDVLGAVQQTAEVAALIACSSA